MEVQMTDFENAAFAVFIVLLSRAIMNLNVNFYIPISKVRSLHLLRARANLNILDSGLTGRREYAPRATA
jgi:Glutamate-cysteine ligase